MSFTPEDKARARYHLGYPGVQPAAMISFGMPASTETSFLVDNALDRLVPVYEPKVLSLLNVMDAIEKRMESALCRLSTESTDGVKLRRDEIPSLEAEYQRWGLRLANLLGCVPYQLSPKYQSLGGAGQAQSIPVRH
jgi:hypothetical protein